MRRVLLALVFVGGVLAALEPSARATSCAGDPWHVGSFGGEAVPVDFRPWLHMDCFEGSVDEPFGTCTLETTGQTIAVTPEASGTCEPLKESVYGYSPERVVYFVPAEPLMPGWTYRLVCTGLPESDWSFTTRPSDAPATPAEAVSAKVRYRQDDEDGCCGGSDYLVIEVGERVAPYLSEGGLIEVLYPTGEVVPLNDDVLRNAASVGEPVALPPSFGPLELTPVAANGARGPTTRIERDDIYVEPVYIPCAVSRGSTSLALWLLGPLLWIGTRGRRRAR